MAIAMTPVETGPDSIDVTLRVADAWSFFPQGAISPVRVTLGFAEDDFAGLGHLYGSAYTWNHSNGKRAFTTGYLIPSIRNSYINAALRYDIA